MQRMFIASAFLLLTACGITCNGGWSNTNTALEIANEVVLLKDKVQTIQGTYSRQYGETNPILTTHSSRGKVEVYFDLWMVFHPIVSCILSPTSRLLWQGGTLGVEIPTVVENNRVIHHY